MKGKQDPKLLSAIMGDSTKIKHRNLQYVALAEKTKFLSDKGLVRANDCATYLQYKLTEDFSNKRVDVAHLCHGRWCPICAKARVKKDARMILSLMQAVKLKDKKEFLFLTLTVPNVKGMDLRKTTDFLYRSFNRFVQYKKIKAISKGNIRKLEVTYNSEKDTYHPHIHAIIAVNKTYFKSKEYLKRDTWLELWQKATKMKNITQVDIRRAKMDSMDAVLELATYSAKIADVLDNGEEVFKTFSQELKNVRSLGFSGLFKEYKTMYDNDVLDVPLLREELENDNEWVWLLRAIWKHNTQAYDGKLERIEKN